MSRKKINLKQYKVNNGALTARLKLTLVWNKNSMPNYADTV